MIDVSIHDTYKKNKFIMYIRQNYWVQYTCLALIAIFFMYYWIWPGGASLSSQGDNINQHYIALTYIGQWYRHILKNIFFNHTFEIPLYDFELQYGADIINTFSHYGIGDPFYILSAFIPSRYTEYLFWFLVIFRTYLMGVAFSKYSFYRGNDKFPTMVGSIIYLSCGFNIGPCMSQIIFQSALVWFPFVLLGIEKAFKENNFRTYMISSGVFACSSIYFYYMSVFGIIVYCIGYVIKNKYMVRDIVKYIFAFVGNSLLGLGSFSFLILPISISMLESSRRGTEYRIPVLYDIKYYLSLPGYLFNTGSTYSEYFGFNPVAVVLFIFLLVSLKNKYLRIMTSVCAIGLAIPWFGHLLNGNSYVGNRWTYMLALGISYCATIGLSKLDEISETHKKNVFIVLLGLCGACLVFEDNRGLAVFMGLLICTIFFWGCTIIDLRKFHRKFQLFTLLCVFWGIFNLTQGFGAAYTNRLQLGTVYDEMYNTPVTIVGQNIDRDKYYRIDQSGGALIRYNQSLYHHIKSTEYYWSTASSTTLNFLEKMGVSSYYGAISRGMDSRRMLEDFLGINYYLVKDGEENDIPYLFDAKIAVGMNSGNSYSLYKSDNDSVDLLRYFTAAVSNKEFESMDLEERQELLLQAVVLDQVDKTENDIWTISSKEIDYHVLNNDTVTLENGKIIVSKDRAYLTLELSELPQSGELYAVIEGIRYKGINPYHIGRGDNDSAITGNEAWQNAKKYLTWKEDTIAEIQFGYDGIWKSIKYPTPDNQYGYGRDSFICNLGYVNSGESQNFQLYFTHAGEYDISSLRIIVQPMTDLKTYEKNMYDSIEQTSNYATNSINSTVKLYDEGYIQYAIPYSKGWTAYINGEKTELERSSIIFMGTKLPAGEYEIELKYVTPGLKAGIGISVLSIVFIVMQFILKRKEVHKTTQKKHI